MSPIRTYRAKHGLTLQQFADMVGVQRPAIWKYENGMSPSLKIAVAIERATCGELRASDLLYQGEPAAAEAEPAA